MLKFLLIIWPYLSAQAAQEMGQKAVVSLLLGTEAQ